MYVVEGVSGNTGSRVAEAVLAAGKKLRVLVRDAEKGKPWAAKGAEVRVLDVLDGEALAPTLVGAEGVYLLSPPDVRAQDFVSERRTAFEGIAKAVREAKPGHVVFLSSIGAQHPTGTGPIRTVHHGERALAAAGVPTTFVRAAYFMENWGAIIETARKDGVVPAFFSVDRAIPMVSATDIGPVLSDALLGEAPRERRVVELTGPEETSAVDVATALASLLGRPVKAVQAPLDAVVPTFTSFGFSENVAGLFREMYAGIEDGTVSWDRTSATILKQGPTDIRAALARLVRPG